MTLEGLDALTGPHPVHIHGAELIHRVGLVAAVHQGQVHHDLSAVRQGKLGVHNSLHFCHGKRLAMGHVLGGHKIPPGPDHPVQAIFLHVDPAGQQFGPRREGPGRNLRLPLHDHFGVGFQFRVLPRLCQPGVDEVVEQFRVVLGPHELPGDVGKPGEWGIQGIHPVRHTFGRRRGLPDGLPPARLEHGRLVPVGDDTPTRLAHIGGHFGPFRLVWHVVLAGPLDLCEFQFDKLPTVWAWHKVVLFRVRLLLGFPDRPGFQGRGGGQKDFSVEIGLCALNGQGYGVGLFLCRPREFVHFIQE